MKKIWTVLAAVALVAFGATTMTSCDKDNDDDDNFIDGGASKIAGTYNGDLSATVMGIPCEFDGKYDFKIEKQKGSDDEVIVTLPECTYAYPGAAQGHTIPSVTIRDVDVEKSKTDANVYLFEEDDYSVNINGTPYVGKIAGKVAGSNVQVNYTMRPGAMQMDINFTFTGTLK